MARLEQEIVTAPNPAEAGDVRLFVPQEDVADPELSIVIPALNEELTVGEFVDWCKQGLEQAGIVGGGPDRRQLGRPHRRDRAGARGEGSEDAEARAGPGIHRRPAFRPRALHRDGRRRLHLRLPPARTFVERFHDGYEFVMGSRWRGTIEPGSMPALHRYLGTPVTTWILNRVFGSRF